MSRTMRTCLFLGLLALGVFGQDRPRLDPRMIENLLRRMPPDVAFLDSLSAAPQSFRLEFENERMRVLRLTLKAHESVPVHEAKPALIVCAKGCNLRLVRYDDDAINFDIPPGQTRWVQGGIRSEKNLAAEPLELLLIEPKSNF